MEQTGEAQPWFELDFHAEKTFKKIKYTPRFDNTAKYDCTGRILKMRVQIPEGDSWKTVQEFSLNTGKEQGEQTLNLDAPQTATKVRLVVLESFHHESAKKNKAANIAEIDVMDQGGKSVIDRASADASGWTPKVYSSSTEGGDAGGAAALIDGNPNTYWHSNYGQGSGDKKAPYKVTIDRGASKGEFQTVAYLPRPQANANGSWQEFEVYASDTEAGLFEPESKLQNAEGSSVFRAGYDKVWENGQAKWMYFGLKEKCSKQFVGIKVIKGQGGFASAAELDLMSEQFTSVPGVDAERPVLKASDLELKGEPVVKDTNVTLNDKAKSGKLVTFNFEPKQFGASTVTVAQKVAMYDGDHYMRKWLEIESSDKTQRFNYIDGEHLNVKDAKNTWTIPTNKGGVVAMDMEKSILGQPFYAEGMFFGSEFPETDTQIVSGDSNAKVGRSRYWTGKNFADFERDNQLTKDGKYVSWQTVVGASHSDGSDMNVVQADFFNYINQISKPSDFRIQYNSWFDNMMFIDDQNIIESFLAVDKHLNETGVRPIESYVVDDGWNQYRQSADQYLTGDDLRRNGSVDGKDGVNHEGFWQFNNKFPDGLTPSSNLVQKLGSDFGVWIGPRGGYNYQGNLAAIIADAGNGSAAGGSIDVADQRYVTKFKDMAVKWMKDYGVNYWKWDGFADSGQYGAFNSGDGVAGYDENHQHMFGGPNGYYHSTDLWEKWIDLFDEVWKTANEEQINKLWISLTCYVNPSPWFLQWSNSVWMQCTADRGERTNGVIDDKMNAMLTYRDGAYYDFVKNHDFQFPMANIYNHDPIFGKEGTGITADSMDGEQFRNYLYMMGTRGTAFWELYYSDSIFNDEKYLVNADFLKWEEENFDMLRNAKWVGGNPSSTATLASGTSGAAGEQDAYGFAGFNNAGDEGIISMRNPAATAKKISFKLDSGIGCKSDGSYHVVLDHVYTEGDKAAAEAPKTVKHGQTIEMTLQPGEVQIWHLSKDGDTAAPILSKLYTESNTTLRVQASEHVSGAKFEVLVNGKKVELADNAVKAYADLKTFDITLPAPYGDNVKIEVKAIAGTDAAGNKLEGSIARTGYTGGIIATVSEPECTTISRKAASVEGSDGFSAEVTVVNPVAGKTILSQGNQWSISINGEGKAVFTMNGVTAVSDVVVPNLASISVARENNGMMKLYVNGEIAGSAFDKKNVDYTVAKDTIKIDKAAVEKISNVVVYDRALGYDEVVGAPLASLIARAKGIQGAVTADSWAAAGMDQLIAAAEAAQGDAQVDAFVNLTDGYNQLLPKQPEVPEPKFENLAQGKNASAAFVGAAGDATNAGSPLSNALDGKVPETAKPHAIFGADNQHKPAYMQVDLGSDCDVSGVQLWRFFDGGKKYDTTALVASNDPEFAEGSYEVLYYSAADKNKDLFGLGVKPTEDLYAESKEGKVLFGSIEDKASQKTVRARYIRLYGNGYEGSNGGDNHVVELKVFGKKVPEPAKKYQPYEYDLLCMMAGRAQAIVDNGKYFTSESLAKVEDALKAARKTIATIDADVEAGSYTLTYGDVYKVRAALESAVACAQERETSDMVPILPSEPVKPSTPLTPLTPAEPIKPGGPGETQGQKPGSSSDKLVQTGDDSLMLIGGTAAAAVALAGAGIALKRRRSNA
ncbi:MAG: discoidin domain-containing protein [Collinsella intestinalis]|nr:discoidin domain-containing protein [Collinsella intestinalis]